MQGGQGLDVADMALACQLDKFFRCAEFLHQSSIGNAYRMLVRRAQPAYYSETPPI